MIRDDVVVYGNYVALLPFQEKFVSVRSEWMKDKDNRINPTSSVPTYQEEHDKWKRWMGQSNMKMFMIADVDKLVDLSTRPNECLIGEAQLTLNDKLIDGEFHEAKLDFLMVERSVRRRAMLSEALLLLLQFGLRTMGIVKFVVHPGSGRNRLLFAFRDEPEVVVESGTSVNVAQQKIRKRTSTVVDNIKQTMTSALKVKRRADIMHKLTDHLTGRKTGDHWPQELDFDLTPANKLELVVTDIGHSLLEAYTCHAGFLKYRCMLPDGHLRLPLTTRLDVNHITCIPYLPTHVTRCHVALSGVSDCKHLGVASERTMEDEKTTQQRLMNSPDCYSFCVCLCETPGQMESGLRPIGRALITIGVRKTFVYLAIGLEGNPNRRRFYAETFVALMYFIKTSLFSRKIKFPTGVPKEIEENKSVNAMLQYERNGEDEYVDSHNATFRSALTSFEEKVCINAFDSTEVTYTKQESTTATVENLPTSS
eukprot:m.51517 g.51517  ORF g.51517 m.51517 type:complete len:481 (-) comp7565_c0_seq1:405-1847(-)